jgi:hypothetical protein
MRVSMTLVLLCGATLLLLMTMTTWVLTVPRLLTPSSFFAAAALLVGCAWVTAITYVSARPANRLAQSLHDIDIADAAPDAHRIG